MKTSTRTTSKSDKIAPAPHTSSSAMSSPPTAAFGEFELLRKLTEAPGVPGREERIRQIIESECAGLFDETSVDPMGNLICLKRATRSARGADRPQRVMIACHMDEIGFYVRYIDDDGHLRLHNVGGFDTRNLFARRVLVQGQRDLIGILNPTGRPIHLATEEEKKKIPEIKDFYVDLFMSKKEAERLVQIGDPVTLLQSTEMVGKAITGKAMDNRVALWVGLTAIRKLLAPIRKKSDAGNAGSPYDIYFVACTQEEVGLRGATTAAFTCDADIGIAIDTTLCCDTPGISRDDSVTLFGGGVGIKVLDGASISHRGLFDEFLALARKHKIKHQIEVLPRGGTDAAALQRARGGTRAITLSVPTRYIHTVTETIHRDDAQAAADLLAVFLRG